MAFGSWLSDGGLGDRWSKPRVWIRLSVAGAAELNEQGHRDFRSMIRVFPFNWGNVNDGAINTDHHIAVLNINLELH